MVNAVLTAAPLSAAAQEVVIAALGDSLTQGYGLPPGDGFVPRLQAWLDERNAEVRLINAGVSGDTTAGGLSRVDWTLTDEVGGLIVALGGNDLLRGLDPAVSRANLDGILSRADDAGVPVLLAGLDAPGNYGPEYEAAFDAMYADLAQTHGAILYPDFLGPLTEGRSRQEALSTLMQGDAIHPNARGVELVVAGIGPSVLDLAERVREGE